MSSPRQQAPPHQQAPPRQQAIVDIGSNSIRLVVFGGAPRAPVVLYNEKLMAGLGRGVVATGRLEPGAVKVALAGLARFAALKAMPGVKASRLPQIGDAGALLSELIETLKPSVCVVSAFGLREGLLFERLDAEQRARDPLIEGARFMAEAQRQVPGYSEALCGLLNQLFGDEPHDLARLRNAACLLRGIGWSPTPNSAR